MMILKEEENIEIDEISKEETAEEIEQLDQVKQGEIDGLEPEIVKYIGDEEVTWLWKIYKGTWDRRLKK